MTLQKLDVAERLERLARVIVERQLDRAYRTAMDANDYDAGFEVLSGMVYLAGLPISGDEPANATAICAVQRRLTQARQDAADLEAFVATPTPPRRARTRTRRGAR